MIVSDELLIDTALLRKYQRNGPRYTSYPTADRFIEAFDARAYAQWLAKRRIGGIRSPLSLYVHLPFCESVCYYCACNKIVTKDRRRPARYIDYFAREVELQSGLLGGDHTIQQMHWGGGTPTFLGCDEMRMVIEIIHKHFPLAPNGEYGIEVDPRKLPHEKVALLAKLGFNRMSLGVQDFDPSVQAAVNRIQSEAETLGVVRAARDHGFKSVNLDLIYGLPRQTVFGFDRTLDRVIDADPDRIALYSYAHLPARFKPQRRIAEQDLPTADAKLDIFVLAIRRLTEAGYVYIGMDHFAKPSDELALAQRQGRLYRDFQGYSTGAGCDLIGLGVSAIGKIGPTYSQNIRTLDEYYDRVDRGVLPITRGIQLSGDDLVRRTVIQALMCNLELSVEAIEMDYLIDFRRYFAIELEELKTFQEDGRVDLGDGWMSVTPRGRLLVRNICMVFDKYLRNERERAQYSKVI
jgi:oxygen-independent coproporphyrinogen III oxidase